MKEKDQMVAVDQSGDQEDVIQDMSDHVEAIINLHNYIYYENNDKFSFIF